ncbi:biotin-dependent carboxyltransferase family protein [Gramella sp. AN32]|uniref:Biotin-dependent carboxyltransferase family protein n=1 Tax=Christiangramia antarctica TaxID=2058158 RepID=A0ABW5X3I3_9FLAO|nr:biotin-dependent carboxyltransferase family protein [Gramella sp. AN32]MCM4155605.1 allophanate hydrolase [Gramella sp. AN32]
MKTGKISIITPGIFSTIQDSGRFGFKKYGVPVSGAMDHYAFRMVNLILGNQQDHAVMEITMAGPVLQFSKSTRICFCGGDFDLQLNDLKVAPNEVIQIQENDIFKIGRSKQGFRGYLGISGGFQSETVLNSKSMYEGLTDEFRLSKNTSLAFNAENPSFENNYSSVRFDDRYLADKYIPAYPGPEFSKLSKFQQLKIYETEFSLAASSNRMAIQFEGNFENDLKGISSAPVIPGTVQLIPSGKLFVLGKDCQTTGGYPRVLQLSEYAFHVIAQKAPANLIQFKRLDYKN